MNDSMKPVLRIAVPLIAGLGALLIGWAVFTNTGKQSAPIPATPPASTTTPAGPAQTPADAPPTSPAPAPDGSTQATAQTAPQPSQPTPAPGPAPTGLRARPVEPYTASTLGSVDESSGQRMRVTLSPVGAGIASIDLADYFETIKRQEHVHAQRTLTETTAQGAQVLVVPFAADVVQVDGQDVALSLDPKTGAPVWREDPPGTFTAIVEDADGAPVLELRRVYTLPQGARSLELRQSVRNLTDRALTIDWRQYGPAELDKETTGYGGDKRRIRFGYLLPATIDPSRQYVSSDDKAFLTSLDSARGPRDKKTKLYDAFRDVWPTERSQSKGYELTWAAMTSRYFAVAVTPLLDPTGTQPRLLPLAGTLRRLALNRTIAHPMVLHLSSGPRQVAPGGVVNLDVAVFAGPQDRDEIRRDPHASASGVAEVIVYNFGGPCGWCTFPIFTHALIALLDALHDYVLFDWALSIMVLVVIVRSILHPVMRWSQIRMQRFGHQMQQMAPKQKKLQEKFKDDPKRMQQEMARLWREEGISPGGLLGCLPMFLQSPVWIALYATLYFAVELRHQGAFFGVFQKLSGGSWSFLGDLAEPDRVYYFGHTIATIPMLGQISSINILPVILGFVFFLHQKYLTPPTTTPLTPEQESQQKMIKVMMVVLFPVMMYNAPSGLAIYFITNSTLAIFENRWIRAHIKKNDLLAKPARKDGAAKPGFLARMMELAEQQRQAREGKGSTSSKNVPKASSRPLREPGKYKRRK